MFLLLPFTAFAITAFNSAQVGSSPVNGYILQTNGSVSTWIANTGGTGISDWNKQTNYGVLSLTPTTTIPVWLKDQLFASSSAIFAGLVTANNFVATGTASSIFPLANISKLSNLVTNGFIKTSSADGTLSVDTNTYLTGSGAGVTAVSVASANGFAGSSSGGATPALTLTTTITSNVLKGNGTAISGAANGTDYTLVSAVSCTNQFMRALTAAGVGTCATVGATDVSLANLTATDASLTFSGTYNGSTARTIGLNVGNSNEWTVLQKLFGNASTTQLSVFNKAYFGTTATTTIDSAGNIVVPSGSNLTVTGKTDGCATWATGVLNSTGSACGSGGGAGVGWASSTPTQGTTNWGIQSTAPVVAIGTSTPWFNSALTIASSTAKLLSLYDNLNPPWNFLVTGGNLLIATSSLTTGATTTQPAIQLNSTGAGQLNIATSSTATGGILILGNNPTTTNGSTTIMTNKLQWDGYDSAGVRRCSFINSVGALTTISGACTQ